MPSHAHPKISVDSSGVPAWDIEDTHIKLSRAGDRFVATSLSLPETVLSWNPQSDEPWTLTRGGKAVCSLAGLPPPLDLLDLLHAPAPSKRYAETETARSLAGIMALSALPKNELRSLVSLAASKGDPYTAFCALSAGADIKTPVSGTLGRHPVSCVLDRKTNEQGHARLKRSLPETRAWLDFLESFGASVHDREIGRDGKPSDQTVGASSAWGGDEARQAALERGTDLSSPLSLFMFHAYEDDMFARALALFTSMVESGAECAKIAIAKASGPSSINATRIEQKAPRFAVHSTVSQPPCLPKAKPPLLPWLWLASRESTANSPLNLDSQTGSTSNGSNQAKGPNPRKLFASISQSFAILAAALGSPMRNSTAQSGLPSRSGAAVLPTPHTSTPKKAAD